MTNTLLFCLSYFYKHPDSLSMNNNKARQGGQSGLSQFSEGKAGYTASDVTALYKRPLSVSWSLDSIAVLLLAVEVLATRTFSNGPRRLAFSPPKASDWVAQGARKHRHKLEGEFLGEIRGESCACRLLSWEMSTLRVGVARRVVFFLSFSLCIPAISVQRIFY